MVSAENVGGPALVMHFELQSGKQYLTVACVFQVIELNSKTGQIKLNSVRLLIWSLKQTGQS